MANNSKDLRFLVKASQEATRKQVEHIFLVTGEDGKLQLHGSSNIILAVVNDDHLHASLNELVSNSRQVEGPILTASDNSIHLFVAL